jgi:hypothetical protein
LTMDAVGTGIAIMAAGGAAALASFAFMLAI